MSTASIEPLAPSQIWRGAGEDEHFVQFYEDDSTLLASLKGYIEHHLNRGAAAIVIATAAHLDALQQQCLAQGLDLAAARQLGQYSPLDAIEILAQISLDGRPDARRFAAIIEPLIGQAAALYPKIVSFDEMVALLWNQGRHGAAVRLEELWNELARNYSFGQYCAYPMNRSANSAPAVREAVNTSIKTHSTASSNTASRLAKAAQLQHETRLFAAEAQEQRAVEPAPTSHKNHQLAEFFDNAPLALHSVALDGTIEWANQAELALLGYSREEYVGRHVGEFHTDRNTMDHVLSRLLSGKTLRDQPSKVRCRDG